MIKNMQNTLKITGALLSILIISLANAGAAEAESSDQNATHSWAGLHAGVTLGVQLDSADQNLQVIDPQKSLSGQGANADQSVLLKGNVKSGKNSSIGGIYGDYLWQDQQVVYGTSAELMADGCKSGSSRNASLTDPTKAPFPGYVSDVHGQNCLHSLATIRGKLGFAQGNSLLYLDAGLAFGRVNSNTTASITNLGNPPSDAWSGNTEKNLTGYVVGVGMLYAITKNTALGLRASHYDLGKFSYTAKPDAFTAGDQPNVSQLINGRASGNLIQVSLDYQY